jgi:hypothetical protein
MKKILINEDEKIQILEKHVDFKKVLQKNLEILNRGLIQEQLNTGVVTDPILNGAEAAGCISGGRIIMYGGKPAYVKIATKAVPGRYDVNDRIVVYNNYTYDVISSKLTKKGTFNWNCPKINAAAETKKTQSLTDKIAEYKQQRGAQEYKDILYKNEANDPTFYQKIPVEGVETGFLYIPKKDKEYLNTNLETKGYTEAQKDVLSGLTSQQFVLNPTPLQRTAYQKVKFDANSEELQGLFPNGIVAYIDPKNLITDINPKVCKQYINQYWESYRDDDSGNVIEFTKNKAQVMACKRRYYPNRWGLLGLAGNQIDKKIDVLSRKANEYDGLTTPSRTSKWLLN